MADASDTNDGGNQESRQGVAGQTQAAAQCTSAVQSDRKTEGPSRFERRARVLEISFSAATLVVTALGFCLVLSQLSSDNRQRQIENALLAIREFAPNIQSGPPRVVEDENRLQIEIPVRAGDLQVEYVSSNFRILHCDGREITSAVELKDASKPEGTLVPGVDDKIFIQSRMEESDIETLKGIREFIAVASILTTYSEYERLGIARLIIEENEVFKNARTQSSKPNSPWFKNSPSISNSLTLTVPFVYREGRFTIGDKSHCPGG